MTTQESHTAQAGSGIGYQGIGDSVAVELDSYFNGAYYMGEATAGGAISYTNWDFDNQLFFHEDGTVGDIESYADKTNPYNDTTGKKYINYKNYNLAERFDHVAITVDGNVKEHKAISYINGLDPTKIENGQYVNLAYDQQTSSNAESTSSTCAVRFADKNVDTRLFTVWIEYDGSKMSVSYANGDYATAIKPTTPQIQNVDIDLSKFDGKKVYMGFTSAVGSSKANHTIHSFQFVNRYDASYKLNYYLKDPVTGEYKLDKSSDVFTGDVGSKANATDVNANYATEYNGKNYTLSTTQTQAISVELAEAGETYEMNVYYDPVTTPTYTVQYYVEQPDGSYKLYTEKTDLPGTAGETATAEIITIDGYEHTTTADSYESGVVNADSSTVLKVYYKLTTVEPTTEVTTEPTTEATTYEEDTEEEEEYYEEEEEEEEEETTANKPKTGDVMNIAIVLIVMLAAGAVGTVCFIYRKKEDK